ncbi:MAG: metallophosphoesterase family protein [Planctomycetota bacterium]
MSSAGSNAEPNAAEELGVSAEQVVETFEAAKEELQLDDKRQGQTVTLPATGTLVVAGDLHDNRTNWRKLKHVAALDQGPDRHLVLQELIHGDHFDNEGREDSWTMLYQAAELLLDFPEQVHFLLANHDLAQIHGEGISKGGLSVCEAFTDAIKRDFGSSYATVEMAITEFLLALPLAVRAPSAGLYFCHSLPAEEFIDNFDFDVLARDQLGGNDYRRRVGPVYQLIWGRNIGPQKAGEFADALQANVIVTGHQPQESGYLRNGDRHLIIASDHARGVFLKLPLENKLDMDAVERGIHRFLEVDDSGD